MTGEERERDLLGKINIDAKKEGIDAVTRSEGDGIEDQSVDQEGIAYLRLTIPLVIKCIPDSGHLSMLQLFVSLLS